MCEVHIYLSKLKCEKGYVCVFDVQISFKIT
jgi:hypothetical protein